MLLNLHFFSSKKTCSTFVFALVTVSASAFAQLSEEVIQQRQEIAAQVRWERAKRVISVLAQAVTAPGPVGDSVREAVKERDTVLFNQDKPLPDSVAQTRLIVASLFKNETTRNLLVSLTNQEIRSFSTQLKTQVLGDSSGNPMKVDEIVLGMGPEAAAYVQEKTTVDPARLVLVVSNQKKPGGVFADVAAAFALNSTNRRNTGDRARIGAGDLNYVHDIVGIPDYKGKRWVEAGSLAEVTTEGIYLSSALPLVETELQKIRYNPRQGAGQPKYEVQFLDLATQKTFFVLTDKVVIAAGLGTPKVAFQDAPTQALYETEKASAERARRPPRIESYLDFMNRVGDPENRKPLRDLVGEEMLLVGGGDSGRTVAELLSDLAPEGAYKSDVAQVGRPKRVFWFLNYDSFKDCKEYIAETRARYSHISQALNSGFLIPVPGRVTKIGEKDGKYVIESTYKDEAGKVTTLSEEIEYIRAGDPRVNRPAESVRERVAFGRVVLALGFDSKIPDIVSELSKAPFKDSWKPLRVTNARGFEGTTTTVANEHKEAVGVFLAGPANEGLGGLPTDAEKGPVNANSVSLFANVYRTRAVADFLAATPVTDYAATAAPRIDSIRAASNKRVSIFLQTGSARPSFPVSVDAASLKMAPPVDAIDLALRVGLDKTLRSFRADGGPALELRIVKDANGYRVETSNMTAESILALQKSFTENTLLNAVLTRDMLKASTGVQEIKVIVPLGAKTGELLLKDMEVRTIRSAKP